MGDEPPPRQPRPEVRGNFRPLAVVVAIALLFPAAAAAAWLGQRLTARSPAVAITPGPSSSPTPTRELRTLAPGSPYPQLASPAPLPFTLSPVPATGDLVWFELAGDFRAESETRLRAVTWEGKQAGTAQFARTGTRAGDVPLASPDGRLFLLRGSVVRADNTVVANLSTEQFNVVSWADDSRHVCTIGLSGDVGATIRLGVAAVGDPAWRSLATLPLEPDGGNLWRMAACSETAGIVVLYQVASTSEVPVRRLEVRSITDGRLVESVNYDTAPTPCPSCRAADSVVASLDGRTLVECLAGHGCGVRHVPGDVLAAVVGDQGDLVGTSAEGSLVVFQHGVVRVTDHTVIMTPRANEIVGFAIARPGHGDLAVVLDPVVSGPFVRRVVLVSPDGAQVSVAAG